MLMSNSYFASSVTSTFEQGGRASGQFSTSSHTVQINMSRGWVFNSITLAVENNDRFTMHCSSSNMTGFERMETHAIQAPERPLGEIWNRLE